MHWVPVRSVSARHRPRILVQLLALNQRDRYLRFGYLATDAQIARYVDQIDFDADEVFGGYGPRLFNWKGLTQLDNVTDILRRKPDSRQAVIQLFDGDDIVGEHGDVPCTSTLQFMLRGGKLHMLTNMRSNDAFLGLPHDFFCFTMLQEIVARSLSMELGTYKHAVGSLHLYDVDTEAAQQFLGEPR